jgi:F-type H+-transporting ATPase subunit b
MLRRLNPTRMAGLLIALVLAVAPGGLAAQDAHKKAEEHPPAAQGHAPTPAPASEHGAPADAHGAPAGGHGAAEPNPLEAQPALSIWTLVVFIGLFALLGRFAWKPLLAALHQREHHLQHVLEETERARNESEGLLAEHRRQMARAADEVRAILDKARHDAQVAADQMIKQAQDEAEAARQRAQRDIAAARDQALAEIWQTAAETAVAVAGRVLATELTPEEHRRLLDAAIRELPAAGANGHGGRHA